MGASELGYIVIVISTTGYAMPHFLTAPSSDVAIERVLTTRKAKGLPFTGGQIIACVVNNGEIDLARVACEHVIERESGRCTRCGEEREPPRTEPTKEQTQEIAVAREASAGKRCRAIWRAGLSPRWGVPDDGARCILPIGHSGEHLVEHLSAPSKEPPK